MGSLWPRSGTIERYPDDLRAAGAKAYFYAGGTTTPLTVYADSAEGESHPFPVIADAQGRWPNIFVPYSGTGYDVQVKTANNVQLTYTVSIPNPNPIAVSPPPATDGLQTGMIHPEMVVGTKSGFVRLNGRTIGNAISGGTERANADTSNLFTYLWDKVINSIAPVSGGRGGSAAADFAANKTIGLPDWRGVGPRGLADMGNSDSGTLDDNDFAVGESKLIPGAHCGVNSITLDVSQLPAHTHTGTAVSSGAHSHGGTTGTESAHTHSGTTGIQDADHTHTGTTNTDGTHTHNFTANIGVTTQFAAGANNVGTQSGNSGTTGTTGSAHSHSFTSAIQSVDHHHPFTTGAGSSHAHSISSDGAHIHSLTVDATGSGNSFEASGLSRLVTWYIKL